MGSPLRNALIAAGVAAWSAAILVIHDLARTPPASLADATAWVRLAEAAWIGAAAYGIPLLALLLAAALLGRGKAGGSALPMLGGAAAGAASFVALAAALSERRGGPSLLTATWSMEILMAAGAAALLGAGAAAAIRGARDGRRPAAALLALAILPAIPALPGAASAILAASASTPAPRSGASEGAPDIVLIAASAVRADLLEGDGADRFPGVAALARRGVRFTQAHAMASRTSQSTGSLLTGRRPSELGLAGSEGRLRPGTPTLASALAARGYATRALVAAPRLRSETGLGEGFLVWEENPGRRGLARQPHTLASMLARLAGLLDEAPGGRSAPELLDQAIALLDGPRDEPLFLYVQLADAEDPYDPPEDLARNADEGYAGSLHFEPGTLDRIMKGEMAVRAVDLARARALYEAGVAGLDRAIGRFAEAIGERIASGRALVLFTSSHGEEFMDHGAMGHGRTLYQEMVHVPLLIARGGALPEGAEISAPVSLASIPATVLDVAGLGSEPAIPARGLGPLARGEEEGAAAPVFMEGLFPGNETGPLRMAAARLGAYKLIASQADVFDAGDWRRELFDLSTDPGERSPLAEIPPEAAALDDALRRFERRTREAPLVR